VIIPPFLKQGDAIAIIATARKISEEEIITAEKIIREKGFIPLRSPNLLKSHHQFAGTDDERAGDLQWAINHREAKAILIARGGYGTVRIIDRIDFSNFRLHPKWICGYSDITVLHSHIHSVCGIATLHSTMPINFLKNAEATDKLFNVLSGEGIFYNLESHPLNRPGTARAPVIGGNLSLLYALCGSESDIDTKGKILFIEDLDEYLYHIDRMMMNLLRSGKLEGLSGLLVGGFSDMKDNTIPYGKPAEEIISDSVKRFDFPVCFNFPAGHIDRNLPLILGVKAKVEINAGQITFSQDI
jgi:muramoyltetrapeptide carboxypeptidase